jgi:hypothetical protein
MTDVTILLCGGPMSGKTMLARVLVEMLREQGFGVAYSEVSVPPVSVGGVSQEVGEVLVVTDNTPEFVPDGWESSPEGIAWAAKNSAPTA